MNVITTNTDVSQSQIPFGQVGNLISAPQVLSQKSLEQMEDTEISLCKISFSDFNQIIEFEIEDIVWSKNSEHIVFQLSYKDKLRFRLNLHGFWESPDEPAFQPNSFDLIFETGRDIPTLAFIIYSIETMLFLSASVKVDFPNLKFWLSGSFQSPLKKVSEILPARQLAYRLMVIEKALKITLPFPQRAAMNNEIMDIAFCYRAIVDREFDWLSPLSTTKWISSSESLAKLPEINEPAKITFQPEPVAKDIFGIQVNPGLMSATIEQAVIENYDEVKENLSKLDGSVVTLKLRSLNGLCKMISVQVPELPENTWSEEIQQFIDLSEKFDAIFLERYFNLAAATLEGLTEEQKISITKRPTLGEEAFD